MPTLIIQPSEIDTYLSENNPNTNWGADGYFYVLAPGTIRGRPIIKFDFSTLPVGAIISAATLSLYYFDQISDPVGRTCKAYELTQTAWTETGATWNKYDGVTDWAAAGGDYITDNGASGLIPAAYGWVDWDVLALIQHFQSAHGEIAHLLLMDGAEDTDYFGYFFYSKDWDVGTQRPKLTIEYTEAPPPLPTVTVQAVSGIAVTTATGNGNITDTGGENCDKKGFVYGTTSKADPGNVAPATSGYDTYVEALGSFGIGPFTNTLINLVPNTLYYVRSYAHNSAGYDYSNTEVSFTTLTSFIQYLPLVGIG